MGEPMSHTAQFLSEIEKVAREIDLRAVDAVVEELRSVRERGGRVFVLGVGGSAANASHFVNDLRKLCGIEAYAPTDNVAELTARTNDDGWEASFSGWLAVSRVSARDLLFVFSVGGGDAARGISPNLVKALELGQRAGARIAGVVGRDGGHTAKVAHACVVVPMLIAERVTPHVEAFQGVLSHLFVSHPALQLTPAKWESQAEGSQR
jgi:D-sedoheptulose 7-phosphate isomerase